MTSIIIIVNIIFIFILFIYFSQTKEDYYDFSSRLSIFIKLPFMEVHFSSPATILYVKL